jgi:DNA invertase Pin-like site-specific DNA recombinase
MRQEGSRVAALGYVSSNGAARLDDSELMKQMAALENFCARRGWELVALVHEVERTRRHARPALSYAIERLSAGDAACLVVTDLGRLCRSVAELRKVLDQLDRVNARLVSLQPAIDTGTGQGREVAHILCAVSDWERARAAERSRQALEAARAKGAMQPAIRPELKRQIARMRRAGMTLQAIVDELNETGVPTVRGGLEWRVSSVQAAIGYKRPART